MRSFNKSVAGCALAALACACGSTVQLHGSALSSGLDSGSTNFGTGASTASGANGSLGTTGAAGAAGTTGAPSGQKPGTQAAAGNSSAAIASAVSPGGLAPTGPGWTRTTVYIGVTTQKDAEQTYATAGYSGIDIGNTEKQATSVANYLNAHGGLFGRKVALAFHDVPTLSSAENPDSAGADTCTYFTQDRPVIAVVNVVTTMDGQNFRACLARAHVPLFSASDAAIDDAAVTSLAPYFYTIVAPSWSELAPVFVSRLKAEGYFTGWDPKLARPSATSPVKIGLLVLDNPIGHRIGTLLQKTLAAAGYTNVVTYAYPSPGNNIQPAILYFSGNGVTHVISDDIELASFQVNAVSQAYTPRYGINTYNAPYSNLQGVAPASQQVGDIGVGWAPTFDVGDQKDPGTTGPGESRCVTLMAAGGVTYTDRLAKAFARMVCDGMLLTAEAATASGGLSGMSIYQGVLKIGRTFSPAFSFANGLGPSRLFIPGAFRDLAWNTGCSCMTYLSKTQTPF